MKKLLISIAVLIAYATCSYASYNTTNVVKDMGTSTPLDSEHPIALVQSIRMHSRILNGLYHPKVFTSSGTATDVDTYLIGSSSTGILISLPLASTLADGTATKGYVVRNLGAGTVTLSPTVDGVGSPTVSSGYSMSLFTDGTRWMEILSGNAGDAELLDGVDGSGYARSGVNTDITSIAPTTLTATNATLTNLTNTAGTITTLTVTTGSVSTFTAITGSITSLVSSTGTITTALIENLTNTTGTISTLNTTTLNITNLSASVGTVTGTVSVGGLIGIPYLKQWVVSSTTGTGTITLAAGDGISLSPTYNGNGLGTVTVSASGTSTAGGWTDTGTQTQSIVGYPINCRGTVTLNEGYGISGMTDADVPNTITLDNLNQITTRNFSVLQGTATDIQVADNITLTNITQIETRPLSSLTGTVTPVMLPSGCIVGSAYGSNTTFSSWATSAALIPYDNTIPQSSEGVQLLTASYTPGSTTTRLKIKAIAYISSNETNANCVLALFKDSETGARACGQTGYVHDGGVAAPAVIEYDIVSPGTSAATWKLRGGASISGSNLFTVNGSYAAAKLGGTLITSLSVQEYVP